MLSRESSGCKASPHGSTLHTVGTRQSEYITSKGLVSSTGINGEGSYKAYNIASANLDSDFLDVMSSDGLL